MPIPPMPKIETIISPAVFELYKINIENKNVVIIDILRATSTIVWALHCGANHIKPVNNPEQALLWQAKGYLAAAERNGTTVPGFDLGNSPFEYKADVIEGQNIALTTTNGTVACLAAQNAQNVIIGSFLNIQSTVNYIKQSQLDTLLFCAGWKGKFNLEDTLFAGALATLVGFDTECDATMAAKDLWQMAQNNIAAYLTKASHVQRFTRLGNQNDLDFCTQLNLCNIVPLFKNGIIE